MAKNDNLQDFVKDVADAIRNKKGTTESINPQNFSDEIASIEAGSPKFAELIDGTITSLETSDLADVTIIRDGAFEGLTNLTSVAIPSNVTTIGASAFSGCIGITTLTLAEGVTTIGASAFSGISASEINIPSTLTSVGENAFANNTVLSEIAIPDTLTSLSAGMFSGCTNLINVTMEATTPPSVTDTTFPSSASIYVKYGAYDDYVAQWSAYASQIVRLPAIPSTITITVNNYLGEMVSGASVTISGNGQTYTGTTDSVGVFTQGDLQPATYTITVADIEGFKTPASQEVVVEEDTQNSVTVTYLEIPAVKSFAESTPAEIQAISAEIASAGMTSEQMTATYGWKVGDISRPVTLTDGNVMYFQIIGVNHDPSNGEDGLTLQTVNCYPTSYSMGANGWNYASSTMSISILYNLRQLLPQEWQDVIKQVKKTVSTGSSTSDSTYRLFLLTSTLSEYEYWQTQTSYQKFYDADGDGIAETVCHWWTCTPNKSTSGAFYVFSASGTSKFGHTGNSWVSYAFCI